MKTKILGGFIALVLFAAIPAVAQTNQNAADVIIARGNGFVIKRNQLAEVINAIQRASAMNQTEIPPDKLKAIENETLKRMIQVQILLNMVTDADKATGRVNADQQLITLLVRAGSPEAFESKLKFVGMTPEGLRKKLIQEATATATLTRKLGVTISDAEAKKYYVDHPESFPSNGGSPNGGSPVEFKSAEIKDYLTRQKVNELGPAYLDKLYAAANVQILEAALK
jgi:hypothetical protein